MQWIDWLKNWVLHNHSIFFVGLTVAAGFVLSLVNMVVCDYFLRRFARHGKQEFWQALLTALKKPVTVLIWYLIAIYLLAEIAHYLKGDVLVAAVPKLTSVGSLLIFIWFLLRLIKNIEMRLLSGKLGRNNLDKTTIDGTIKLAKVVLFIIGMLSILQALGVPLAAIYTAAGGAGIGITLAAQDVLKNLFGSIMLYFDRPFNIGDWISSPDKKIEGTVEKIGWRSTLVRTFDKRPLYVPNATFLTVSIENPSRMLHRRIRVDVGVRYEDFKQLPKITDDIENMLRQHPDIATQQTIWVNLTNLTEFSLSFRIYAFTQTTQWVPFQKIQQDVLLKVLQIIADNGAQTAFPTQTLQVPDPITLQTEGKS